MVRYIFHATWSFHLVLWSYTVRSCQNSSEFQKGCTNGTKLRRKNKTLLRLTWVFVDVVIVWKSLPSIPSSPLMIYTTILSTPCGWVARTSSFVSCWTILFRDSRLYQARSHSRSLRCALSWYTFQRPMKSYISHTLRDDLTWQGNIFFNSRSYSDLILDYQSVPLFPTWKGF